MSDEAGGSLTDAQRQRAAALHEARALLASRSPLGSAPNPVDLVAIATWVLTGEDPWPIPPQQGDAAADADPRRVVVPVITPSGVNFETKGGGDNT